MAFHPVAAELASVWGADEGGCISGGGVDGHREELCHVAPALNEFLIVLTPVQSEKHTGSRRRKRSPIPLPNQEDV